MLQVLYKHSSSENPNQTQSRQYIQILNNFIWDMCTKAFILFNSSSVLYKQIKEKIWCTRLNRPGGI